MDPTKRYTHLRLNIYPDGGVARLRTYGVMVPPSPEKLLRYEINGESLVDLVAMDNGGVCQGLSDAHYGHPRNLIKKNRGFNMADGWETARRQDRPSVLKVRPNSPASLIDPLKYFTDDSSIDFYDLLGFSSFFANIWQKHEEKPCHGNIRMSHP